MSSHLGATKAAELLATLKDTVRDFSARAAKWNEDFRQKLTREQKHRQSAHTEQQQQADVRRRRDPGRSAHGTPLEALSARFAQKNSARRRRAATVPGRRA